MSFVSVLAHIVAQSTGMVSVLNGYVALALLSSSVLMELIVAELNYSLVDWKNCGLCVYGPRW